MTKKSIIISVISVICLVGIVSFAMYGCSSKDSDKKEEKSGVSGQITVISREEGSGTRDAFVELMGVTDENGNDITADSAELTNSTSVVMSTVKGNKNAIGYVSLGSLSSDVKAVGLDGVAPSTATVKDGSYKLQRPFKIAYIDTKLTDIDKDFISFITSKQGEAIISKEGYISAEATQDYKKSGKKGTITIAGSTSVAPVMNVLADEYKKLNPDVKIEIQESGSSAGIESAIQGAVEIAMSSRELKDDETKTLKSQTIALDGIAVIVNKSNTLDALTSKQVKNIFEGNVSTWEEIAMRIVFLLCAFLSVIAVIFVCKFIFQNGIPAIEEIGFKNFIFGKTWKPSREIFGIFPMILGSIYVTAGAIIIGVPIGIFTAVFLAFYCPKRLYSIMKPVVNLLAGIPSIVYGFFCLVAVVPVIQKLTNTSGKGVLTASILLGIMILPTIINTCESSLKSVAPSYYEGSLALGATKEYSIFKAVFPVAKSGIVSGIILGIGRAVGETMAVVMIAGNQAIIPKSITSGVRTLTGNIVLEMAYASGLHRRALIATAAVLFVFVLIINLCFSLAVHKKEG